jgi:hypothetical protein
MTFLFIFVCIKIFGATSNNVLLIFIIILINPDFLDLRFSQLSYNPEDGNIKTEICILKE